MRKMYIVYAKGETNIYHNACHLRASRTHLVAVELPTTIFVIFAVLAPKLHNRILWFAFYKKVVMPVILKEDLLLLHSFFLLSGERFRVSKRREAHEREGQNSRQQIPAWTGIQSIDTEQWKIFVHCAQCPRVRSRVQISMLSNYSYSSTFSTEWRLAGRLLL